MNALFNKTVAIWYWLFNGKVGDGCRQKNNGKEAEKKESVESTPWTERWKESSRPVLEDDTLTEKDKPHTRPHTRGEILYLLLK